MVTASASGMEHPLSVLPQLGIPGISPQEFEVMVHAARAFLRGRQVGQEGIMAIGRMRVLLKAVPREDAGAVSVRRNTYRKHQDGHFTMTPYPT
jgi:hypothetical protein